MKCFRRRRKTEIILTTTINKTKVKILTMELLLKDFVDVNLALVDHDTQKAITATFSNIVLTSSDVTIFTTGVDAANKSADITGVKEGTASLNVTADVEYTDSNTQLDVKGSKSVDIPVTITAPAPTAENTDLVVTFGTPTPSA